MPAIDAIFATIADFSKTMGTLHSDFLGLVRRDIDRFLEITDNLHDQMQWQGWTVIGLTTLSAGLAVAGSLIPKGATDTTSNTLSDQLRNNEFLRSTCKTGAKFFNGVTPAANTMYESHSVQKRAQQELARLCFQEGQGVKNVASQEQRKVQDTVLEIIRSKAKAG